MKSPRRRGRGRPPYPDVLTPAEWEVAVMVREGASNAEIAARRGTSVDAVRYHIENITGKLQLVGRDALELWNGRPPEGSQGVNLDDEDRRIRLTSAGGQSAARLRTTGARLVVRDVARTAEWFRDVLGFEVREYLREHHEHSGESGLGVPVFCLVWRDGQPVALSRATSEGAVRSNRAVNAFIGDIYFWVSGVDALYEEVRAGGGEIVQELHVQPYGMKEFIVRTPDGHALTFGEDAS